MKIKISRSVLLVSLLCAVSSFAVSQTCPGSAGCMDSSFAGGNLVRVENAGGSDVRSLFRQTDGKIVALALGSNVTIGQALTRLNNDGSVDASFGGDGTVLFQWKLVQPRDTYYGNAYGAAVQTVNGTERIIVVGGSPMLSGKKVLTDRLRIERLMPDGSPDQSWGVNGTLLLNLDQAYSVAIQPWDQKIIIGTGPRNQLVRFTQTGQIDTSFGTGGFASVAMTQTGDLHFDALGRILSVGILNTASKGGSIVWTPAIARHNSNGSPDLSFGSNGRVIAGFNVSYSTTRLAIDPFGNLVLGSTSGPTSSASDYTVERFTSSGIPDYSFSEDGIATVDFYAQRDIASALAVQSDGSVVVAGNTVSVGSGATSDMALARLDYWGKLDPVFGNGGRIVFPHVPGGEGIRALLKATDPSWVGERFYAFGINNQANQLLAARFLEY